MRSKVTTTRLSLSAFLLMAALCLFPTNALAKGSSPQEDNAPKAVVPPPAPGSLPLIPEWRFNTSGGRAYLHFTFNQDMLDVTQTPLGTAYAPEDMPITITPALEGEAKWVDARNLVFMSYKQVPRATTFTIALKDTLKSLSGKKYEGKGKKLSWAPFPLYFSVNQTRYAADGTVTLDASFNCLMDNAKLKSALSVADAKGNKLPIEVTPEKDEPQGWRVKIFVKPPELSELTVSLPVGFVSESGPEGITSQYASRKIKTTSMLAINTVRPQQTSSPPWSRFIMVNTTNSADIDKIRQYLDITPATDVKIEARSNGFLITGDFITRPRLTITFKKGMPGVTGILKDDFTSTVVFDDFSPRMAFETEGTILSPNHSMYVPISSINVEKVQATLWQLPESNIPLMSMGFFDGYKKHLSRKIAVRTGAVNAVRNRSAENSIDLKQIAGNAKGVFLLTLSDASDHKKTRDDEPRQVMNDGGYYYFDDDSDGMPSPIEKLVIISDIGITARVMPDSITVWANSISTTDAVKNARVRVFSANNVLLAEGRTDKDGLWRHTRNEDWSGRERPAVVLVSTSPNDVKQVKAEPGLSEASATDMAYLKLESNLASDSAFDTNGRPYLRTGYEAFSFTPRGVFRPGETVDFKVLVRDSLMKAPAPFPVEWRVRSSTGRTVGSGTAMLSSEGGTAFSLPLVPSAPTGRYTMVVSIPGRGGKSLGFCSFSVEDFQPPRIELKLSPEQPYTTGANNIQINFAAKYLFGAPSAGAPWEAQYKVVAGGFTHPDWRSFSFPSSFTKVSPESEAENNGSLDEAGNGLLVITPTEKWTAPIINVTTTIRVREDGGRWVGRNITVPHYTVPVLMGYEYNKQEPQAGSAYSLRVAAVKPDGTPADPTPIKAVIKRQESYYVRSDRGYTHSTREVPVSEVPVLLEKGIGIVTFTPPQRGEYQIYLQDAQGTVCMKTSVSVWQGLQGTSDGASPLVDRVMLSWERPTYQIGETAVLKVRSPFPGKLMVALEGEKEIFRMVIPMKGTETSVSLPVLTTMLPNAYCSAWVIRPVQEGETWGAHRAYGVIPLMVDRTSTKLNVALTTPAVILPKTELPVSIALTDKYGNPVKGEVTLALVDEGILSLTNHKTPDPFAFFTAKRAMQGMTFDLYDNLMPLSTRKPLTLQAGGGMAGEESLTSPMTRKLEVLSVFLGTVQTDGNGLAQTTLTLPEYSGRGRLMAVAVAQSGVGSSDTNVRVARDVTVEATVPRMVAPGDIFTVPVIAFGDGKKSLKASISIETEGPLAIEGKKTFTVSLTPANNKAALPILVKALDMSGLAAVRVVTRIDGSTELPFEQRLEIPVRPPYPRLTKSGSGIIKGGEKGLIDVGGGFYPGTQRINLSFSDTPGISLMGALEYLRYYPYGCLEQTTSSAWPYLAVPAMLKSIDPEKAKDTEFKQALDFAIRRMLAMQRSDAGFNGWPGMTTSNAYAWASVYAIHFLTEAKSTGLVPQDALQGSLAWMRSYLSSPLPSTNYEIMDSLSVKAYICYVLALNGDAPLGWMQFLKEQGNYLTQSARIFLAGAYTLATGKPDALREFGTQPLTRFGRYGWSLESSPRNEALRLLMWTHADPFAPETALLAKRVIEDGNKGLWRSTQENAMAVLAIGRYVEKTAGKSRDFTASLSTTPVNGNAKEIATFTNKDKPSFSRAQLQPAAPAAPSPMNVAVVGDGTAFYSWTTSGVPIKAPAPFSEGLSVIRRWVLPDGTVYDFIPDADGKLPENMRNLKIPHGTRVTVTLYVKPNAAMNSMVLADITPGGFEIDNPNLVPGSEQAARAGTFINPATGKTFPTPDGYANAYGLNTWSNGRIEMRDDRLLLFVDWMPNRAAAFTYTLRAVNKGEFILPPVSAEDMYDPSIRALTPTTKVTVVE